MRKFQWKTPTTKHYYPLTFGEKAALRIKEPEPVYDWASENFILSKAYVNPGRFVPHQWQREPLDAIRHYNLVYYLAPVQTGKSLLGEICAMYAIDTWNMNGMLVYANEKTAKKVFKFRIREAITDIPCLRQYWSGKEDDLTISNIELRNCIWGVASAENKNDLASFPAGFIYGSEVSKYRSKDFNSVDMMRGRQQAYLSRGLYKRLLESSPYDEGDIFYQEIYKPGTIILTPHIKCPHCNEWQELTDAQIKTLLESKDANKLRQAKEGGVRYDCVRCHEEISEKQRVRALNQVVWAAPEIDQSDFKQPAEPISPDGDVYRDPGKYEAVCYNWNRLIDPSYKFYECLARFFESKNRPDKFRVYQNEDMARFWKSNKARTPLDHLLSQTRGYYQYGAQASCPKDVIVATVGIDTQDTGFYYVIRGFGANMETWLIRHDYIECDKTRDIYKDKNVVYELFQERLLKYVPEHTRFGFIDRGGHRADLVDFLCKRIPWLHAYIGKTTINPKEPLVEPSKTADHFMGQTRLLSDQVEQYMSGNNWHLPVDVGDTYLAQVTAQYYVTEEDKYGQVKHKFICEGADHYRDCENMNYGAAAYLKLSDLLFSEEGIARIRKYYRQKTEKKIRQQTSPRSTRATAPSRTQGWGRRRWSA